MTNPHFPLVQREPGKLCIHFRRLGSKSATIVALPLVLDIGHSDTILGIEAINFESYGGSRLLDQLDDSLLKAAGMRLSYDAEADAFYLKIEDGRSLDQRAVQGRLFLDSEGRMAALEASLE